MTREVSGGCSPCFRGFPVAALAVLLLAGCFSGSDVGTIYCVTDDNCPAGYVCADSSKPGGCKKKADLTLDGGDFDTADSNDGTTSPDGARGGDAVTLLDGGVTDGGPRSIDTGIVVDGPMNDAPADIPQVLPDSSDSYVADAPADPPRFETTSDAPTPVGGIDGSAGAGGTIGTGGATGTGGGTAVGGATGTGGAAGSCGSRDCTSSMDNDCNGTADNQEAPCKTCIVGNSQACSTAGLGICKAGTQTCQLAADHQSVGFGACAQNVAMGSRDCTSSNDNDCNGQADNTESSFCQCSGAGATRSCSTGLLGICSAGTQACAVAGDKSSSSWGTCTQSTAKGTETCANPGTDDDCDGTPDNVPVASCNVGTGLGACASGGNTACSGSSQVCNPAVPGIGVDNAWHLTASPNGSWDWDCDGYVVKQYADTFTPPSCTGLDINACGAVTPVTYSLNGSLACGQVGDIGSSYCYWLPAASSCQPKTGQQSGQQQGCH